MNIGIIGLGDHANENLIPALLLTPGLNLHSLSSRTEEKLQDFQNRFSPEKIFNNWKDQIKDEDLDGVILSSAPLVHYEVAKELIKRNIHVFIEKPPTENIEQLKELIDLSKKSTSKIFVGFNFTYANHI